MRYTFTSKPAKVSAAASRDYSRPALTYVHFDADRGELRATDSYIAVRMPVTPDPGDVSGWISPDALERSRKRDAGAITANGASLVYQAPTGNGEPSPEWIDRTAVATFPRPEHGTPPNLEQLWPEDRDGFTVGINAGFLKRLADALGAKDSVVHLTFQEDSSARPNPLRAILVRTADRGDTRPDGCTGLAHPEGLIMPVRVS